MFWLLVDRPRPRLSDLGRRHPRAVCAVRPAPPVVGAPVAGRCAARRCRRRFSSSASLLSVSHGMAWTTMTEAERATGARDVDADARTGEPAPRTDARQLLRGRRASRPDPCSWRRRSYFGLFFFWRCSGMMLLGMALYKWGFLDGRRPARDYLIAAVCLPWGWRSRGTARSRSSGSASPCPTARRGSLELRRGDLRVRRVCGRAHSGREGRRAGRLRRGSRRSDRWPSPTTCCRASSRRCCFSAGAWIGRPARLRRAARGRRGDLGCQLALSPVWLAGTASARRSGSGDR